uniref:TF_AP-2 domain-containing protein n=1 Tax=Rhabditophanes sp. KR3021 TaxID=114890 RepID=A0AC35UGE7_9BILA
MNNLLPNNYYPANPHGFPVNQPCLAEAYGNPLPQTNIPNFNNPLKRKADGASFQEDQIVKKGNYTFNSSGYQSDISGHGEQLGKGPNYSYNSSGYLSGFDATNDTRSNTDFFQSPKQNAGQMNSPNSLVTQGSNQLNNYNQNTVQNNDYNSQNISLNELNNYSAQNMAQNNAVINQRNTCLSPNNVAENSTLASLYNPYSTQNMFSNNMYSQNMMQSNNSSPNIVVQSDLAKKYESVSLNNGYMTQNPTINSYNNINASVNKSKTTDIVPANSPIPTLANEYPYLANGALAPRITMNGYLTGSNQTGQTNPNSFVNPFLGMNVPNQPPFSSNGYPYGFPIPNNEFYAKTQQFAGLTDILPPCYNPLIPRKPQEWVVRIDIVPGAEEKKYYYEVSPRLQTSGARQKAQVSVEELKRRWAEGLAISKIGAYLRKAKEKSGSKELQNDLAASGLKMGTKIKSTSSVFTSLIEVEVISMVHDYKKLCNDHFHHQSIADELFSVHRNFNTEQGHAIIRDTCYMLVSLILMLNADRSPICYSSPEPIVSESLQKSFSTYSQMTHGCGSSYQLINLLNALRVFTDMLTMINPTEGMRYQLFINNFRYDSFPEDTHINEDITVEENTIVSGEEEM